MHTTVILAALGLAAVGHTHPTKQTPGLVPRPLAAKLDSLRLPLLANYTSAEKTLAKRDTTTSSASSDPLDVARAHVKDKNPKATFRLVDDHYTGSNGITHVRFKQTIHDVDVDNADYNVNIDKNGKVFSYGGNVYNGKTPAKPSAGKRALDLGGALEAVKTASEVLGLPLDLDSAVAEVVDDKSFALKSVGGVAKDPIAQPVYFMKGSDDVKLVWRVETDTIDNWLQTYVDKESKEVHGVVDWVSDATYEVYPWGLDSPDDGERKVLTDPWDLKASEFTWLSDGKNNYTTTRGNNGIAQTNPSGGNAYLDNPRPSSPDLKFEYPFTLAMADPAEYANASVTQLFYSANKFHDLFHVLGFDEAAGNFEINNNGAGGKGDDFVILNAQDGSGKNNANFATPPDGSTPRMRMYIWDLTSPPRDACFDAGVIIHEYMHGVSNRMTGGPANSNCLSAIESGGMGEGWGDFAGLAIALRASDNRDMDKVTGAWVSGRPGGIRQYPYSTSLERNPLTYKDLDGNYRVHNIGTVWSTMLFEVMWNLVEKYPAKDTEMPEFDGEGVPTDGRFLTLKLMVDGMALQPCNPNFLQARDAIIDADKALTGGENACEIWKGFAKRGLGTEASEGWFLFGRRVSDKVPDGC